MPVTRLDRGIFLALWVVAAPPLAAQGGRIRVEYDVQFATVGSLLDQNCTATGHDKLEGTLVGYEPAAPDEPNEYVGTLKRDTDITICGSRTTTAGIDVVCSINITGHGLADVRLRIEEGQRDGYLQYVDRTAWRGTWPPRPVFGSMSRVTGTCDPVELAQLQADYDGGSTAGSPNGQPIEVPSLPPPSFPFIFGHNHPRSIWMLKVFRRRP